MLIGQIVLSLWLFGASYAVDASGDSFYDTQIFTLFCFLSNAYPQASTQTSLSQIF